jgi:serine/threonine protein phosphatase PrpC
VNRKIGTARLFVGDEESCDAELASGIVCVRSVRGPDKAGPNEDAAALIPVGDDAIVLAVADGVGGSPGGCEASATVVETLEEKLSARDTEAPLRSAILDAFEAANQDLITSRKRSATTLVVAEISGTQLRCYHVGDSELLVVGQRGRIKQRIIPHSPTGFAVEAGLLDEEEAVQHEDRHVIFNVVGEPNMRVDVSSGIDVAPRDTVLLTSDGVLDNLYVDEIIEIIRIGPLGQAADKLIAAARERMLAAGGTAPSKPDDATIVLYRRPRRRLDA